jgi:hypothetical protein
MGKSGHLDSSAGDTQKLLYSVLLWQRSLNIMFRKVLAEKCFLLQLLAVI